MSAFDEIKALDQLIETLRGENGCPWDRKQTPEKMIYHLLEESHELMQAIEVDDTDNICEELGDVLFQVMFIAKIFQEKGKFDIEAAARRITEKMVHRHPHVFGEASAKNAEEVLKQWHTIKQQEKKSRGETDAKGSVLDSIPSKLPPLMRAYLVSERAARTDFDWNDIAGVMEKAEEEWAEFRTEVHRNANGENSHKVAMEFGDLMFTLVNVARFAGVHPETAINASTNKFEKRFRAMESAAEKDGRTIDDVPRNEKEAMWNAVKSLETR